MADTLNQVLVTQFADMVNLKAQQKESFLRGRVKQMPLKGKRFTYENLESEEAELVTSRHQPVALGSPQHQRRWANVQTFHKTWAIDRNDQLQSLVDLQSPYVDSLASTMARQHDRLCAQAALADVLTGESGTTTVTFANDQTTTVTASSGLVYDKLREVISAFYSRGIGLTADEKICLCITDKEHSTMLDQVEIISKDYRNDYVVDKGKVMSILGMDVIVFPSNPITGTSIINPQSATVNNCFAFATGGIVVGMNSDIEVRIEDRPDLVDSKQVKALFRMAALRGEGSRVVKIDVTNS